MASVKTRDMERKEQAYEISTGTTASGKQKEAFQPQLSFVMRFERFTR